MPSKLHSAVVLALVLAVVSCNQTPDRVHTEGSGHAVLTPIGDSATYKPRLRQLVYVPIYSSIYWGADGQISELSATLSIRNVSTRHSVVVHSVKYFDSAGKLVREYVSAPASLGAMAAADFVIQRRDTSGGPGASFLVDWSSAEDIDSPVIEAIMIGQHGNAGISFSSHGRPLSKASEGPAQ